ncbi:MAG TPA: sulfotransferase family protein [Crenotrichaceae bacterium]|nr:sulfotransferase family protein [Crenotrichaceae bacterium]
MKKTVLILGMHRSGTSWLTGSLQQAGLYLGKHHSWNPHNRKGNRENPDVMALHESILAENHGAWDVPPEFIVWSAQQKEAARQLVEVNTEAQQQWGFKDPRTLLMLEGWKLLLDDIAYIGIFRHPLAVARSLHNRGGMPRQQALQLWEYYNTILLNQYQLCAFPLLCFDWSEHKLNKAVSVACRHLQLETADEDDDSSFFDADLRHNQAESDIELPESITHLYERLSKCSQQWAI